MRLSRSEIVRYAGIPFCWSFTRETHLSALQTRSQAPSWLPRAHGNHRWPQGRGRSPGARPQEALGLTRDGGGRRRLHEPKAAGWSVDRALEAIGGFPGSQARQASRGGLRPPARRRQAVRRHGADAALWPRGAEAPGNCAAAKPHQASAARSAQAGAACEAHGGRGVARRRRQGFDIGLFPTTAVLTMDFGGLVTQLGTGVSALVRKLERLPI